MKLVYASFVLTDLIIIKPFSKCCETKLDVHFAMLVVQFHFMAIFPLVPSSINDNFMCWWYSQLIKDCACCFKDLRTARCLCGTSATALVCVGCHRTTRWKSTASFSADGAYWPLGGVRFWGVTMISLKMTTTWDYWNVLTLMTSLVLVNLLLRKVLYFKCFLILKRRYIDAKLTFLQKFLRFWQYLFFSCI